MVIVSFGHNTGFVSGFDSPPMLLDARDSWLGTGSLEKA